MGRLKNLAIRLTILLAMGMATVLTGVAQTITPVLGLHSFPTRRSSDLTAVNHDFDLIDTFAGGVAAGRLGNGTTVIDASGMVGADCGAKINAAEAILGASAGQIIAMTNCGTSWTTAVTISNPSHILFIGPGSYTIYGITVSGASSGVLGYVNSSFGTTVVLTAASGAGLTDVVTISGAHGFIRNIDINGNIAASGTSSSGVDLFINEANRFDIENVTTQNAGSHGIKVYSTVANESCCGRILASISGSNNGSGLYMVNTGDVFLGGAIG